MERELAIILFGATGFTGKRAIPVLSKFGNLQNLSWGIAGRSEQKLRSVLGECENKIGAPLNDIPIIIADTTDQKSVTEMARRAQIVINCCGPYRFFGEPVVKACVEESTHYVDVTGEPEFMEKMQLKYHDQAREKGIYVISACGFDSIPADLGVVFVQQKFKGTLNSVVLYFANMEKEESLPGPSFNYATWESAIYGVQNAGELKDIRKKLFKQPLPNREPKLSTKFKPHKCDAVGGWAFPFLGADRSVIKRSQRYFYELDSKRPAQVETYFVFKSPANIIKAELILPVFALLTKSEFGRSLLLKYPEQFSAGVFSHEPPSDEKLDQISFCLSFLGEGWKETLPNPDERYATLPNRAISAQVTGKNPAYGATCICLVLAAITVITERDKMPLRGGVYPPGYAFAKTSLIERLNENGIKFEVLYEKDLPTSKY